MIEILLSDFGKYKKDKKITDADWELRFLIGFLSYSFVDSKIVGDMVKYIHSD